jgi:hypothetical protein
LTPEAAVLLKNVPWIIPGLIFCPAAAVFPWAAYTITISITENHIAETAIYSEFMESLSDKKVFSVL